MANNYNDALERAKQTIIDCGSNASRKEMIYSIFPELRESEDERIRKEIVKYLTNEVNGIKQVTPRTNEFDAWMRYLEKQKGQKPNENITDEEMKQAMDDIHNFKVAVTDMAKTFNIKIDHNRDIDWHNFCASLLTYLKRHAEWSKNDRRMLDDIDESLFMYEAGKNDYTQEQVERERKWLKSLSERFK